VQASNQLSGTLSLSGGNNFKCGDQMLTADTVINTPPGSPAVLIIENGQLDLNGHALTTSTPPDAHEPRALKCGRFASTHDCG
jgi:hypothetical protein